MCFYHVANGNEWKRIVVGLVGCRIDAKGTGGAVTGAYDVCADDKIFRRIDHMVFTNNTFPPLCCVGICSKCMADPDYIVFVLIECSIRRVGNGKFAKSTATF